MTPECAVADCGKPVKARSLCQWHYTLERENDPDRPRCAADDCVRGAVTRGLCTMHYQRKQRGFVRPDPICSVAGCERPRRALGWCMRHYDRMRNSGDLDALEDVIACTDCGDPFPKPTAGSKRFCAQCAHARLRNRERQSRWRYLLWEKYRIREADYFAILARQGGVCAICGGPPKGKGEANGRFSVDHDHDTGRVRGLLCSPCNSGLGHMQDSIEILTAAAGYLAANGKRTTDGHHEDR